MPHDARGRLIEVGDFVKVKPHSREGLVAGVVVHVNVGSQSCSGSIRWPGVGQIDESMFDAKDATLIAKADGSEPGEGYDKTDEQPT